MRTQRLLPVCVMLLVACDLSRIAGAARAADAPDPAKVAAVLGTGPDSWTMIPAAYAVTGEPAVTGVPGVALTIEAKAKHDAPSEHFFRFRLKPPKGATASLAIQLATGTRADKSPQALNFSVSLTNGQTAVSYSASAQGGKPPAPQSGTQHLVPVTERSLGWTDEFRRGIEAQIAAAPKPEEFLFTVRCTVEKGRFRAWLNGRYSTDLALEPDFDPSGVMKITLYPGAELVLARSRPLQKTSPRFEPLSIAGNLTGATPNVKRDPARPYEEMVMDRALAFWSSQEVPFQFSAPNASGNDHIDVGTSWTRFGSLPGYIAGNFGSFGGRWVSADRLDPSRICQYVPAGRYKALHLIAVADDRKDAVPVVTAQFYRPDGGHPMNFSATVPKSGGASDNAKPVPITLADGKPAGLFHVTIPLDPDAFSWFTDLPRIGLEITKEVKYYRGYPDPLEYSWHGGGLPSSVQIYAMTLERADVDVELVPGNFGHVWTAPSPPEYTLELRNRTGVAQKVSLNVKTQRHDGTVRPRRRGVDFDFNRKDTEQSLKEAEKLALKMLDQIDYSFERLSADLPADDAVVRVPLKLKARLHGLHELSVSVVTGIGTEKAASTEHVRSFAYLHADTRDREPWEEGRGSIFGFWPWQGGHVTPTADKEIIVMAAAGAETSTANYSLATPEIQALAQKHRFLGESAFHGGIMYFTGFYDWYTGAPKFDPAKPEETAKALIEAMKKTEAKPGPISRPTYVPFFAEPQIGNITTGIWPSHYGEDYKLTEAEQKTFEDMKAKFVLGAKAIRKQWPNYKLLIPYGDPMNTAVFLKMAPETRDLIDGCALDMPGFERMPEQQINQVVLNRLYPILKDVKEHKKNPYLVLIEGFCVSSKDIDTGERGQADIAMRDFLVLMGYGVTRFESPNSPFDCANYWGENHYGGGWNNRLPLATPKLAYTHYATMTRHLNRANFTKYVPVGSHSTYCQQFKHYKTGKLVHVLWTLRGTRPATVKVPAGASVELWSPDDNLVPLKVENGTATFALTQSPQYLEGLPADAEITLGESDHSDSKTGEHAKTLGNLGDGAWTLSATTDDEYRKNKPLQVERFLGKMTATTVDAPGAQGGKALAIHLEKQEKDRGVMPFFNTLTPKAPVVIPGKASHLGLWAKASSDWGRFVYVLRDAKDEKWISVGTKEDWNNDDIHCWSSFCFDGWRYMKFQLPSSLPYDSYREHGTSWWGSYGGDGIVDLPLRIEKILIERRPKVIYGNDLVAANPADVLLADLRAEYATHDDATDEAVRLSKIRRPLPENAPALTNPIAELAKTGVGEPTKVQKVADPNFMYDGTRCHVHFDPVPGATGYDIWVSPYADGRGAIQLAKGWKASGELLQGLRPDIEFHLFVLYTDKDGKLSKPSAPLAFKLKDRFGYK